MLLSCGLKIEIKHIAIEDWSAVSEIYMLGIETGIATFETEVPSWEKWDIKFLKHPRLAAWSENKIMGWAALSIVSSREVYKGVAEVSVYVHTDYAHQGIGIQLLEKLIVESENNGIWTLQAGIFRGNIASINLHKKIGFREIGYREKVAKRDGIWHDNIIMERRSKIIGIH
ncbi:GNAT family N-acetyltransferase [Aureibaculum conchae]|uniref:GNAT family N-acetyltransferase n=1 Tax=Aureibaculum sp. 2308TA14-22 TaxID=3108392 RepID=UPI0033940D47